MSSLSEPRTSRTTPTRWPSDAKTGVSYTMARQAIGSACASGCWGSTPFHPPLGWCAKCRARFQRIRRFGVDTRQHQPRPRRRTLAGPTTRRSIMDYEIPVREITGVPPPPPRLSGARRLAVTGLLALGVLGLGGVAVVSAAD